MAQTLNFSGLWASKWTYQGTVGQALMSLQQNPDGTLTGTYEHAGGTIEGNVAQVEGSGGSFAIATGTWSQANNKAGNFTFVLDSGDSETFFGCWDQGAWWGLITS